MQGHITVLEGEDLQYLCAILGIPEDRTPRKVRIYQSPDAESVKIKVNEDMWSWGLGTKDGAA